MCTDTLNLYNCTLSTLVSLRIYGTPQFVESSFTVRVSNKLPLRRAECVKLCANISHLLDEEVVRVYHRENSTHIFAGRWEWKLLNSSYLFRIWADPVFGDNVAEKLHMSLTKLAYMRDESDSCLVSCV